MTPDTIGISRDILPSHHISPTERLECVMEMDHNATAEGCVMPESSRPIFNLSREEVLRRQARREIVTKEITRLTEEVAEIDSWLKALSVIFPEAAVQSEDASESKSVWKQAIDAVLENARGGMTPRDIAQAIREVGDGEARKRLQENPNGHYNALDRMENKGHYIKHNDKYYLSAVFYSLTEEERDKLGESQPNTDGMPRFVLGLFDKHEKLSPSSIRQMVAADPIYGPAQQKSPGIVYSALHRLTKRQILIRDGSDYSLPKKNEPHGAGASHGSDAGSVFD